MAADSNLPTLQLEVLQGRYGVLRLRPDEPVPHKRQGEFYSVTRTERETSVVLDEELVPPGALAETGFALLRVKGELDFSLTGILAALAVPLAEEGLSIFAVSTFDTDYFLVRADELQRCVTALQRAGHVI